MCIQATGIRLEGPADPLHCNIALWMVLRGWGRFWVLGQCCQLTGCGGRCLAFRVSSTVPADGLDGSGSWSTGSTFPHPYFIKGRAAHIYPASIIFENELARLSSLGWGVTCLSCCWIILPLQSSPSKSPASQAQSHLPRTSQYSLAFEEADGLVAGGASYPWQVTDSNDDALA